jgi:hypothetical protein
MKVTVVFTKDFAVHKKGDEGTYNSMLASRLVNIDKVAKVKVAKKPKETI